MDKKNFLICLWVNNRGWQLADINQNSNHGDENTGLKIFKFKNKIKCLTY